VSRADVLVQAGRLAEQGEPFALATVVSVVPPASTRRGDRALVTADGGLAGWVGGSCSEPTVVRESLAALEDGEPRLVRIGSAESCCASEGTIEVLVEPQLPAPLLCVVGESPAAEALARVAPVAGWRVVREIDPRADAVVVATMGAADADALESALRAGAGYVGVVASAKRTRSLLADLRARGLDEEAVARVLGPAGLDLDCKTQEEIAISIAAELVAWRHRRPSVSPTDAPRAATTS
jgi:xanthine dehydrogenase accessory factor